MPTKNPRLTITLQPSLAAQLRRLSELTGNSQGALISELLDGSAPVFDRMIRMLEAAEVAKESFQGSMSADLAAAQTRIEAQLGLSLDVMDDLAKPLLEEAEKVQRRARRGGVALPRGRGGLGVVATPLSNRGVRSKVKVPKSSSGSRS